MNSRALQNLSRGLNGMIGVQPYGINNSREATATNISNFIAPVQFERLAHDIKMWRECVREMELAFWPMRVRVNRMYMDTVENPSVKAMMDRCKELTTQRDYQIFQYKNGKKVVSEVLSQALAEQLWFDDYIEHIVDAIFYGYTNIELGNIVNDGFPDISTTRRENIRPDGIDGSGPILTSLVYSVDGVRFTDDRVINMFNHWIPTKSNRGVSKVGYGLLYNMALCEIHLRHIMEWNMDYLENYGMPITKGSTNKQGKERKRFEAFLRNASSNRWILLDKNMGDDITLEHSQEAGTAWRSYGDMEMRLNGILSKLVFGHEDAMQSTPGKLGGLQASNNKDGSNISIVQSAINAKQIKIGDFTSRKVNEVGAPRFREIGAYVGSKIIKELFPIGYHFGLKNDVEEDEVKRKDNRDKTEVATYVAELNKAGWNVKDSNWLSNRLGFEVEAAPPESKVIQERTVKSETVTKDGDLPKKNN